MGMQNAKCATIKTHLTKIQEEMKHLEQYSTEDLILIYTQIFKEHPTKSNGGNLLPPREWIIEAIKDSEEYNKKAQSNDGY